MPINLRSILSNTVGINPAENPPVVDLPPGSQPHLPPLPKKTSRSRRVLQAIGIVTDTDPSRRNTQFLLQQQGQDFQRDQAIDAEQIRRAEAEKSSRQKLDELLHTKLTGALEKTTDLEQRAELIGALNKLNERMGLPSEIDTGPDQALINATTNTESAAKNAETNAQLADQSAAQNKEQNQIRRTDQQLSKDRIALGRDQLTQKIAQQTLEDRIPEDLRKKIEAAKPKGKPLSDRQIEASIDLLSQADPEVNQLSKKDKDVYGTYIGAIANDVAAKMAIDYDTALAITHAAAREAGVINKDAPSEGAGSFSRFSGIDNLVPSRRKNNTLNLTKLTDLKKALVKQGYGQPLGTIKEDKASSTGRSRKIGPLQWIEW